MTTDTPRTDSLCFKETMESAEMVLATFARDLERELAHSLENQVKSQAEVERLLSQLNRAVEIAEEFWNNQKQAVTVYHEELAYELALIKATLNQTNK